MFVIDSEPFSVLEQFPAAENKAGFNMLKIHSSQNENENTPCTNAHKKILNSLEKKCGGLMSNHKAQGVMDRCFTHIWVARIP